MFFFKAKTLGHRAAAPLISLLSLQFYIAEITVQATTNRTKDDIIELISSINTSQVTDKVSEIVNIVSNAHNNKISQYRIHRIFDILNKDEYGEKGYKKDYSVRALLLSGELGFDGSPIGLQTVHSRLNELYDLLVRSTVTDTIGESTDAALQNGSTIFSKLNYIKGQNSAADSDNSFADLLTVIKKQLLGMAYMLTSGDIFGYDGSPRAEGIIDKISAINTALEITQDNPISNIGFSEQKDGLYYIYNILVKHIKDKVGTFSDTDQSINGLSVDGLISAEEAPAVMGLDLLTQLNAVKTLVQGLPADMSDHTGPPPDLGGIAQTVNYLFPSIEKKIAGVTGADAADIAWKKKNLIGHFAQPGLTLMNCLHNIRRDLYGGIVGVDASEVADRETDLTTAQAALTTAQAALTAAQEAFTTDQEAFTTDQEAFTTDQEAFTTDQEAFTTDQEAFTTDQEAFTTDQSDLTADQEAFTTAQVVFANAQKALTNAKDGCDVERAKRLFRRNPFFWALTFNETKDGPPAAKNLHENFSVTNLYSCINEIATDSFLSQMGTKETFLAKLLSPPTIRDVTNPDSNQSILQTNFADYYNYSELITLLLFPSADNEKREKLAIFSSPFIKCLYEYAKNQGSWPIDSPWFRQSDSTSSTRVFNFIKKMLTDGAIHIDAKLPDGITLSDWTTIDAEAGMDCTTLTEETMLFSGMLSELASLMNGTSGQDPVYLSRMLVGAAKKTIGDVVKFGDSLYPLLQPKITKILNSFPTEDRINTSNVMNKCKTLEKYIEEYNGTTSETDKEKLLGTPEDHPADITIYGAINGILFEDGAQILLNHIGSPSDPAGVGDNVTLYSRLKSAEDNDSTEALSTKLKTVRNKLGQLVGAIRYKYADLQYNSSTYNLIYNSITGTGAVNIGEAMSDLSYTTTPVYASNVINYADNAISSIDTSGKTLFGADWPAD
ncbi:MAG: hypothetical protein LBF72_00845 [Holosporales bacterium]|jgi:hypothetical protein|nr:hypothetical protein [Holosporales bacterium]